MTATRATPVAVELRARLAQLQPQRLRAPTKTKQFGLSADDLAQRLAGQQITDGVIRIQQRIPLSGKLGSIDLRSMQKSPRLPGEAGDEKLRRIYIDTETTGLSGGSGTLAFLIGIAHVTDDAIELTQFLLTRFAAEAALLSAFAASLKTEDKLISYNGKSYDLPLLLTRFRMQALPHPFAKLPHLDLLHPVRRVFRRRWPDCRLITLEEQLLGFSRQDDLPGAEAPAAWFSYIRHGEAARLMQVVEHNRQDIISLALAHAVLARAIEQPRALELDLTALARWLMETNPEDARLLLQSNAEYLGDDGKRLLGQLARQACDWKQALTIWQELATRGCTDSMECLAKYHEHVSKDLLAARHYSGMLPGEDAKHEHRRQRLQRKLSNRQISK